jgi:pimeloyl-ACP methyl ester carboxylesterase
LFGYSSGAVLALDAANRLGRKVKGVFMFEPPFSIDDSQAPLPADYLEHMKTLMSQGRRDDAVEYFMRVAIGVPPDMLAGMRQLPMWPGLVAATHTLPYDGTFTFDLLRGKPLPTRRGADAKAPTMVLVGSKSPPFFHAGARSLAGLLAEAQYRTLEGADHAAVVLMLDQVAAAITEFFAP